jgi:hypothetical protein
MLTQLNSVRKLKLRLGLYVNIRRNKVRNDRIRRRSNPYSDWGGGFIFLSGTPKLKIADKPMSDTYEINDRDEVIPCAGVWGEMDQFDRAWFYQSVDGTLREDQRGDVEGAIADHERAGNWNVSSTMRKFKFKQNANCPATDVGGSSATDCSAS